MKMQLLWANVAPTELENLFLVCCYKDVAPTALENVTNHLRL